jgi:hypothetical protein
VGAPVRGGGGGGTVEWLRQRATFRFHGHRVALAPEGEASCRLGRAPPTGTSVCPMRTPPLLVETPADRYFLDDHCANCLELLPEDVDTLFCSPVCSDIAGDVRYFRRVVRDGVLRSDVHQAVHTRIAWLLIGGYGAMDRTLDAATRAAVKQRDGGLCRKCGKPGDEIDHIAGSSPDLENLQLLCKECHREKTATHMRPANREQTALVDALFQSRVLPDKPKLLADDESEWESVWRGLKKARRARLVGELEAMGIDITGLRSRAEMIEVRDDAYDDEGDVSYMPDDYDGGFGPESYFARAMPKDN